MFADARRSAGRVKLLLDQRLRAKQADLTCGRFAPDVYKEVRYYKMFVDLYESNVKLMNCVVAYLNDEISMGRKEQAELDRIYAPLIRWLNNMEQELRRVLDLPSSEIGEKFEGMRVRVMGLLELVRGSFANNPKKYAAAVGAVAGGVLLQKHFSGVCLATDILKKLGLISSPIGPEIACTCVGFGTSLAVGAIGGVFLVVVGACIYNAFSSETSGLQVDLRLESSFQFQDVNRAVDNMKEALQNLEDGALAQDLRNIAALWDQFNDFNPEVDTEACPVCLSEPPQQPVRFRGCLGQHFHCFACREECVQANAGGGICTVCRHDPVV